MSSMDDFLRWSQILANVATCLALIGIAVAYQQLRSGAIAQKRTTAITAWTEYLKLALAHPEYARPQSSLTGAGVGSREFSQYRWFVATMLFACEQVLEAHSDDEAWEDIVTAQLRNHHAFLNTPYFDADVYAAPLTRLATKVKREAPQLPVGTES
jgi:hypothetical protein